MDPRELGDPDDEELRIRRGRDFLAEGFVEVASFGVVIPFRGWGWKVGHGVLMLAQILRLRTARCWQLRLKAIAVAIARTSRRLTRRKFGIQESLTSLAILLPPVNRNNHSSKDHPKPYHNPKYRTP